MKSFITLSKSFQNAFSTQIGRVIGMGGASIAALLVAPCQAASAQALPSISMQCVTPAINVKFTSIQHTQASTGPVQFNVNIPAGQGTIFVDKGNSGICTATISEGYQFIGGYGAIDETQISVSGPHGPRDLMHAITIGTTLLGNQVMRFSVSRDNEFIKGNLNILFTVRYKRD